MSFKKIKVLHCITSLDPDGAQQMLLKICSETESTIAHSIVCLRGRTEFSKLFEASGIRVHYLGMKRTLPSVRGLLKLRAILKAEEADIFQGWMYHGNLALFFATKLTRLQKPLIWNIRKVATSLSQYSFGTKCVVKLGALFSSIPHAVIYCGEFIAYKHFEFGFSRANAVSIANGFDTARFSPKRYSSSEAREHYKLPVGRPLVGMTARFHPHKGHSDFIEMASLVKEEVPEATFVLAGRDINSSNKKLTDSINALGLQSAVYLLDEVSDTSTLLPAFDVYCQSSISEGFPNAIGEAMSCQVPCVSTDVGAASEAIGDTGYLSRSGDPQSLADSVLKILLLPVEERNALGTAARERVLSKFSIAQIAKSYEALYLSVLQHRRGFSQAIEKGENNLSTSHREAV